MNKWLNKWFNDPFNLVWNVYLGCLNWLHWLHPSRMSSSNEKSSMYRVRIQTCITVDFPPHYSSIVFVPLGAKSALPSIWGPQRVTSRYSCSSLLFHIHSNRDVRSFATAHFLHVKLLTGPLVFLEHFQKWAWEVTFSRSGSWRAPRLHVLNVSLFNTPDSNEGIVIRRLQSLTSHVRFNQVC